jgi:6-phosphofructokinase 1
MKKYDMEVIGFYDGFQGLAENRGNLLSDDKLSGILTLGGTILGTSRYRPDTGASVEEGIHRAWETYRAQQLDALVCMGGDGTQRAALRLMRDTDMRIVTLPKTIDNDIAETEVCFGFDTAAQIATDAIDRLHSNAQSHHRVMLVEIMGNRSGWLTVASGLAGGADVVIIPEIPYNINKVADALRERERRGKRFSIVAVAEGSVACGEADAAAGATSATVGHPDATPHSTAAMRLLTQLPKLTGLDARLTTLGYVMRGGTPSVFDRNLATQVGTFAVDLIAAERFGVMVAMQQNRLTPVALEQVAGRRRLVPLDHPMIESLRALRISLGD